MLKIALVVLAIIAIIALVKRYQPVEYLPDEHLGD
jgi:hypothetical protein